MRIAVLTLLALSAGLAQQSDTLKHFSVTTAQNWSVRISAEQMARQGQVLHLKGHVEIKTWDGPGGYDRFLLLHADEADFHIDTGAIQPRGNVSVEPYTK